jgi:hypothetical protein
MYFLQTPAENSSTQHAGALAPVGITERVQGVYVSG